MLLLYYYKEIAEEVPDIVLHAKQQAHLLSRGRRGYTERAAHQRGSHAQRGLRHGSTLSSSHLSVYSRVQLFANVITAAGQNGSDLMNWDALPSRRCLRTLLALEGKQKGAPAASCFAPGVDNYCRSLLTMVAQAAQATHQFLVADLKASLVSGLGLPRCRPSFCSALSLSLSLSLDLEKLNHRACMAQ